jgi:plastocyanin
LADDGRGKRRRGRKRGRGQQPPHSDRPDDELSASEDEEEPEDDQTVGPEEESEGSGRRFGLPFGGKKDEEAEEEERAKKRERERARAGAAQASPMDFWRRGQARPYREAADRQQQMGLWKRVTGLYFPPWVPVVGIIVIVFGILGLLFFLRSSTGAPRIGQDHWHATYEYIVCGVKQPNFPTWNAGVHTHADGYIHIHPYTSSEEGSGARLVRWFEYGGGELSSDTVKAPGSRDEYKNGDQCPDGEEGFVQVFVNGQKLDDFSKYLPQDGDSVQIVFGPEREEAVTTGNAIPESEATRELTLELSDGGVGTTDATITPGELDMETGEAVKINVTNTGTLSQGLRVSGPDAEFNTSDDFLLESVEPGGEGFLVVRFNDPGEYQYRSANFADRGLGTITVTGDPVQPIAMTVTDNGPSTATFEPSSINVVVGKAVRLVLTNEGELTHGITIPGADGTFGTEDDVSTEPGIIEPGETGVLSFVPDEAGEITFVDVQDVQGTIVVSEEGAEPDGSPTPAPGDEEPVDVELDLGATNEGFDPAELRVEAGARFRITLTANDAFIHNVRIAGPDGEYNTDDDLTTDDDAEDGGTATLTGEIDEAGTYEFRDDFHPELTGTLIVE